MTIVDTAAEALQHALGPHFDQIGRDIGIIRRHRKFSGSSLLKTIVLTLLRCPHATISHYATTAAMLGVVVTPKAIAKRFTPHLVAFLRQTLEHLLTQAFVAAEVPIPLLAQFRGVFLGDSTTLALPEDWAAEFPGCGGQSGSGKAALKIQLTYDLTTGTLQQFLLEPGRQHDNTSPALDEVPPPGSLTIRDLGYFDLARFQKWSDAGAFWISRWQSSTHVFDPQGQPLDLWNRLQQAGPGVFDASVVVGATQRLPCRLIALRVPPEIANRRRQQAHQKAQKHGGVPSATHQAWCDWTVFITNCSAELLTWKEVVVLYRARWQIELLFKLWKSGNRLTGPAAVRTPECRTAELWGRLIGVVLQHWLLLATAYRQVRRSLWKAAAVIRDWMVSLIGAWDQKDRLTDLLYCLRAAVLSIAKSVCRKKHPSTFQLLIDPNQLDW